MSIPMELTRVCLGCVGLSLVPTHGQLGFANKNKNINITHFFKKFKNIQGGRENIRSTGISPYYGKIPRTVHISHLESLKGQTGYCIYPRVGSRGFRQILYIPVSEGNKESKCVGMNVSMSQTTRKPLVPDMTIIRDCCYVPSSPPGQSLPDLSGALYHQPGQLFFAKLCSAFCSRHS
jgi:hypothetical protein